MRWRCCALAVPLALFCVHLLPRGATVDVEADGDALLSGDWEERAPWKGEGLAASEVSTAPLTRGHTRPPSANSTASGAMGRRGEVAGEAEAGARAGQGRRRRAIPYIVLPKWFPSRTLGVPGVPVANFAVLSWGPGFLLYVVIPPKWVAPSCLNVHYYRRLRGNESQNQPVWMRDAFSCLTLLASMPDNKENTRLVQYPGVPCPRWVGDNIMCHLMGDHISVQSWEKWADYSLYVDNFYTPLHETYTPPQPYVMPYGRRVYTVRIRNCDPTKDCPPFPKNNSRSIGFKFVTTKLTSTTTKTTTRARRTSRSPTKSAMKKKVSSKCPAACRVREVARKLWPSFFVTTILVMFVVLPCIYFWAKRRKEAKLIERWYKLSSMDERVNFVLQTPPAWQPGWPPGPSTGEPSRTDPEGKWRSGDTADFGTGGSGPPPAKRRRR